MTHNYAVHLTGAFQVGGTGRVVMPEEVTGRLFSYARTDLDGALIFTTTGTTSQLGDVVRRLTDSTLEYRSAGGDVMRFDSGGKLIALVDRNNNTSTLGYSGSNLTSVTDPVGRSLQLEYDGTRIRRVTDPLGRSWQYGYDVNNNLVTVTDPLNNLTRYGYDSFRRLASITDSRGNLVKQITYDANGRVSEQKFADGGRELYSYTLSAPWSPLSRSLIRLSYCHQKYQRRRTRCQRD